jgi:hypothetical protein
MLTAVPKRWFSWDFTVMEGSQAVAEIDISWWRERGMLTVQGVNYRVYREGRMSGEFILESADSVMARAEKPSAFHRSFTIDHEGRRYTLQAKTVFGRGFLLLEGDREIGSLSPEGIFTRRAIVDFPQALPLPVRVFIIWLAVILWKRESDSAAAAA